MDNTNQQPTQPGSVPQGPPPMTPTQPVPMPSSLQQPPKKKRTGLIIGIVLGSIALISIITGVLFYFLWWQNPQKVVTDAVVGAITTRQAIVDGTVTYENDGTKVKLSMKSSTDAPKSSFDTTVSISSEQFGDMGDFSVKLAGTVDNDGTIYVKAEGLKEIVDAILEAYVKSAVESSYGSYSDASQEAAIESAKKQFSTIIDPIVAKIDGQWLKISANDFTETKESKCVADALVEMQNDKTAMDEIGKVYREHPFLVIKDTKVPSKDGATGYEIDLTSDEAKQKAKDFGKGIKETTYLKKIDDCTDNKASDEWANDLEDSTSSDKANTTLRVWVDPLSHKLKQVEVIAEYDDNKINMSYSFEMGKSDAIEIPSNARNMKEVIEEIQEDFQKLSSGSGYSSRSSGMNSYDSSSI